MCIGTNLEKEGILRILKIMEYFQRINQIERNVIIKILANNYINDSYLKVHLYQIWVLPFVHVSNNANHRVQRIPGVKQVYKEIHDSA